MLSVIHKCNWWRFTFLAKVLSFGIRPRETKLRTKRVKDSPLPEKGVPKHHEKIEVIPKNIHQRNESPTTNHPESRHIGLKITSLRLAREWGWRFPGSLQAHSAKYSVFAHLPHCMASFCPTLCDVFLDLSSSLLQELAIFSLGLSRQYVSKNAEEDVTNVKTTTLSFMVTCILGATNHGYGGHPRPPSLLSAAPHADLNKG